MFCVFFFTKGKAGSWQWGTGSRTLASRSDSGLTLLLRSRLLLLHVGTLLLLDLLLLNLELLSLDLVLRVAVVGATFASTADPIRAVRLVPVRWCRLSVATSLLLLGLH